MGKRTRRGGIIKEAEENAGPIDSKEKRSTGVEVTVNERSRTKHEIEA